MMELFTDAWALICRHSTIIVAGSIVFFAWMMIKRFAEGLVTTVFKAIWGVLRRISGYAQKNPLLVCWTLGLVLLNIGVTVGVWNACNHVGISTSTQSSIKHDVKDGYRTGDHVVFDCPDNSANNNGGEGLLGVWLENSQKWQVISYFGDKRCVYLFEAGHLKNLTAIRRAKDVAAAEKAQAQAKIDAEKKSEG